MSITDPARTSRRAFWGDARFLLGILLIVSSVAGVWFVVSAARQTAPAFAAARTIVEGQPVVADDLREVDVSLGSLGDAYLAPAAWTDGLVATRTVPAGELVPADALGAADSVRTTSLVVESSIDVPASVGTGDVVEVWGAPVQDAGTYDEPRILVADATVVSVERDDSVMGGGSAKLEVVIPRADVAAMLAALSDGSALSVVPAVGGAP